MTSKIPFYAKPVAFLIRDFKIAASYRLNYVTQGFAILLTTFSFFLVSKMIGGQHITQLEPYGGDYFSFVLIGIALTDYLTISTNTFATEIRNAQMVGTLESLLVTPTSINIILISSFFYKLLSTSLRMFFYLLLGVFVFGIQFRTGGLFTLAVAFLLTLLPFFGLGLFSAAFTIVFKQGNPISTLIAMSSGLLGGVIYPVTVLPDWLRPLSSILPITHGLEAMRQVLLSGAGMQDISRQLYMLLLLSILFMGIGCGSIYYSLKIAKKEGSLLHY